MECQFIQADMREIPFEGHFDAVINMFSAFGYLENDEQDFKVLEGVAKSLKPHGQLFIDTQNRERVMRQFQPQGWETTTPEGRIVLQERELDLMSGRVHVRVIIAEPDGRWRRSVGHVFRLYSLSELNKMLQRAGFTIQRTYGDFAGSEYDIASRRMIVLARRSA